MTDKDRRRWSDLALDLLSDRVNRIEEGIEELRLELRAIIRIPGEFAAFRREFDDWKRERRQDIEEFREIDRNVAASIAELQKESRLAHKNIAYGKDPENGERLPTPYAQLTWTSVAKILTVYTALLGPVAVIVAAFLAR